MIKHSNQSYTIPATNIQDQRILILDFGSQYTQLIARRVRECQVYSEIYPFDVSVEKIIAFVPSGIILSGGPESVLGESSECPKAPDIVFELGCPVLGICYGMQTMASQLGGKVSNAHIQSEFGHAQVEVKGFSILLKDIEDHVSGDNNSVPLSLLDVWMSHGDQVSELPAGFNCIARSNDCIFAGMANEEKRFYGLQFHPEVTHTHQGARIINRFVKDICGCQPVWTPENIIENQIQSIQETVGKDTVLLGLSGGVDSSVVAALLHRAIGEQLVCVFIDTGLLRAGEGDQVMQTIGNHFGVEIIRVNAADQFFSALKGVFDPEEKRKIIGNLFVELFDVEAAKLKGVKWLAQGTIYPDVIESAGASTGKAHVIKSHHNVAGLPEHMKLSLLEPVRSLFKDEVRKMGLELGLPYEMVYRHPFPGPGLGVRILGEVCQEYADILREADIIFIEALKKTKLYETVSQAFAVFLPVKSVGVAGDARKYEYVIALRAVKTVDFMTARAADLPFDFLQEVSRSILNRVPKVARVVYDISDKPPATIEWE